MANQKKMQRQLLWNSRANEEEQSMRYIFVIVNESRERESIKSKIIETLAPVDNFVKREGKSGANPYCLLVFDSPKRLENPSSIYNGAVKRDIRLYERQTTGIDGLEDYIIKELSK